MSRLLEINDGITVFQMTIDELRSFFYSELRLVLIDFIENERMLLYVFSISDNYIVVEILSENRETISIMDLSPNAYIYEVELINQYNFKIKDFSNIFNIQKYEENSISFKILSDGKKIHRITTYLGFNYREIEKYLIKQNYRDIYSDLAKFFNNCTAAHVINYNHCILDLFGIKDKNNTLDNVLLELQRINNHLLWIILLLHDFELNNDIIMELVSLRTHIYDILTSKFTKGIPIDKFITNPSEVSSINTDPIINRLKLIRDKLLNCKLDKLTVGSYTNCTGVIARSIEMISDGDIHAHLYQRLSEIDNSIEYLNSIDYKNLRLNRHKIEGLSLRSNKYAINCIEAPNGELIYLLKTDNLGRIYHMRIAIPSMVNLPCIISKIENNDLKHLSLLIKFLDIPLDQLIIENGSEKIYSSIEFRKLAKEAIVNKNDIQLFE